MARDPRTHEEVEAAICTQALVLHSTRYAGERRRAWKRLQELKQIKKDLNHREVAAG